MNTPKSDWPCKDCEQYKNSRCTRPLTPGKPSYCVLWYQWFTKWWPIVTGKKRAAPGMAVPNERQM